jgi:hypothetical protein
MTRPLSTPVIADTRLEAVLLRQEIETFNTACLSTNSG